MIPYRQIVQARGDVAAHHAWIVATRGLAVTTSDVPRAARVNHNRWLVDCPCGAGAAVDLGADPPVARCYEDGVVHVRVVLPPDRAALEAALLRRPLAATRNWHLNETVADLAAENAAHGVA